MPNIKSAEKRVKVIATKNAQNRMAKTALKTELKRFSAACAASPENAETALRAAYKKVDQAVAAGLLHKNTAARRKSSIARAASSARATQTQG